jgi:DNA polymerase-3 subunit beta
MKFSCQTTDFLHGIQLVSRAISGQQALPILGNILFKVEGSTCTVSATDLELSMITSFPASIESEGAITIPSKAILNFAQYNTDPEIVLETVEGTHLKVTSKHSKTSLSGEAATSYPSIPAVEKKTSFKLDAAPLLEALNLVTFASARTSLRPVLSGVYLRTEGGKLILVATDSYRLSECSIPTEVAEDVGCIIPVKVLEELKGMLSSKKPPKATPTEEGEKQGERKEAIPVEITLSAQQIEVQIGNTRLVSRLIEGKFPDYRQIIPKEHTTKALINTRELTAAVKRMHYFAKEVNNNLTFTLSGEEAHIHTPQTQLGKDETTISAEITGTEGKIALSSSYLLDFLGHIDTEVLELRITDSMHPAVFYIPANDKFLHLIMPLRMQES